MANCFYRVSVRADWSDCVLFSFDVPSMLAANGIASVRQFVRDHMYQSPLFDCCTVSVVEVTSNEGDKNE